MLACPTPLPSVNEPTRGLILVHTVKLKPVIKAQISGNLVTSGISDVVTASVYSEFEVDNNRKKQWFLAGARF